jgi:hypothetical protein
MFSEILKIIPKLDSKDLSAMESQLQSRFTKIAKGFGKGLSSALKLGGIASIGLALVDKLLNPLKETQEAIDKMLKSSDDISTNARQFNTTSGRLLKLVSLAKATGLDQDNLFMLLNKYQTAVAEAKADPNKPSAVRNFVGKDDTAEGFFEFIQSLQKMDKSQQLLVQQSVFGEKQILKMADFLQSDFARLYGRLGLNKVSSSKLTGDVDKLAGFNDLTDELSAKRNIKDVQSKAQLINNGMIQARNKSEELALERENKRIQSFTDISAISQTMDKVMTLVEEGVGLLGKLVNFVTPAVNNMVAMLEKFAKSPLFRGLFKGSKDK